MPPHVCTMSRGASLPARLQQPWALTVCETPLHLCSGDRTRYCRDTRFMIGKTLVVHRAEQAHRTRPMSVNQLSTKQLDSAVVVHDQGV